MQDLAFLNDLEFEKGDLKLVQDHDLVLQEISWRLGTPYYAWIHAFPFGSLLFLSVNLPLTPMELVALKNDTLQTLQRDPYVDPDSVQVVFLHRHPETGATSGAPYLVAEFNTLHGKTASVVLGLGGTP